MVIVQDKYRVETYKKTQQGLDADMVRFTNDIAEALGIDYPVETELPIATTLQQFEFTKVSLDQVLIALYKHHIERQRRNHYLLDFQLRGVRNASPWRFVDLLVIIKRCRGENVRIRNASWLRNAPVRVNRITVNTGNT